MSRRKGAQVFLEEDVRVRRFPSLFSLIKECQSFWIICQSIGDAIVFVFLAKDSTSTSFPSAFLFQEDLNVSSGPIIH